MRRSRWARGRGHSSVACLYVERTQEEPDWWCTSISEYAASRGSTGGKLLGASLAVSGALQVVEASLLAQVCVAPYSAASLLWAGGVTCIVLGQVEASDMLDDDAEMVRVKKGYALLHAVSAMAFVALSTAGVLIISPSAEPAVSWLSAGLAMGGSFLFLFAVGTQQLTGNWIGTPSLCPLPQQPADRRPEGRWGRCHRWLGSPTHRLILSRITLFTELAGVSLVIFSVTYLGVEQTISRSFCSVPGCFRQFR